MTRPDRHAERRARTRENLRRHALRMFLTEGYEAATVERIAAAAGVSHMTFFRHFPTKEAVVFADDYDAMLEAAILARPAAEPPLEAVRRALVGAMRGFGPAEMEAVAARTRLVKDTPALRNRIWENEYRAQQHIAAALAQRAGLPEPGLRLSVLAAAAQAALLTALWAWADDTDAQPLADVVDAAFAALINKQS
ncbi:TetR/AcrR family transcriptional regulator [Pseudonocardia sp. CA-107938]|uniref:TetR/AcrR family transcriptional regulator n=1 Tax=Pseudonocardia sp. CA-107938 TaxID=3240021 RepID=UPI003D8A7E3A